jgi:hypothetical protein
MTNDATGRHFLQSIRARLLSYKTLAEEALAQCPDDALYRKLDDNTNAPAIMIQHLAGNYRSRFTDFGTTDGEKPWRERDREFELQNLTREQLIQRWNESWTLLLQVVDGLQPDELLSASPIRGRNHTRIEFLLRVLGHTAYHIGQLVQLVHQIAGDAWRPLSIPLNQSEAHNEKHWGPDRPA